MPTYDYECQDCRHRFEYFQKMSDVPLDECPECAGKVRRVTSGGTGLIFKGSGFYITDYAKKNSSNDTGNKTKSKTSTSDKPASKPAKDTK